MIIMTHVSKLKISEKVTQEIENNFIESVVKAKNKTDAAKFLEEILTATEKTMIAKRIAVILMIDKGASFRSIQKTLKVSPATISDVSFNYKNGKYIFLAKNFRDKKFSKEFWSGLGNLLTMGMPSRVGRDRFIKWHKKISGDI